MFGRKLIVLAAAAAALAITEGSAARHWSKDAVAANNGQEETKQYPHGSVTISYGAQQKQQPTPQLKISIHKHSVSVKKSSSHKHHKNKTRASQPSNATVEYDDDWCTGDDESPMSVEGVEDIFCVQGDACVADFEDGVCPGPQEGLEFGAYCGEVQTGVFGCIPLDENDTSDDGDDGEGECGDGESPMSVEGVEGVFCVAGKACVADVKDGTCPGPQEGLPNGAECGIVKTGVYGCKPKAAKHHHKSSTKKNHTIKVTKHTKTKLETKKRVDKKTQTHKKHTTSKAHHKRH